MFAFMLVDDDDADPGLVVVVFCGNETVFFSSSFLPDSTTFGAAVVDGAKLNIFFIVSSLFSFGVPNVAALLLSIATLAAAGMPKENVFFSGSDGFFVGDAGTPNVEPASFLLGCSEPKEKVLGELCVPDEATDPNENVAFLSDPSSAFAFGTTEPNENVPPFGVVDVSFVPAGEPNVTVALSGVSAGFAAGAPNEKMPFVGTAAAAGSFDAAGELPNVKPFLSGSDESVFVAGEPNVNVLLAGAGVLPMPNVFFSASFTSALVAFDPKLNIPVEEAAALREESFAPIGDPKVIVFFSVSPVSVLAATEPNENVGALGGVSVEGLSLLPPANPNVKFFSDFPDESVVLGGIVPKEKVGVGPALVVALVAAAPPKLNNPLPKPSLSLSFEDEIPNPDDVEDAFLAPSVLSAFSAFGVPKVNIFLLASAAPIVP